MAGSDTQTKSGSSVADGDAGARVRQLVVVATPVRDAARPHALPGDRLMLGRAPEGTHTIALEDDEASRAHAVVEYDAGKDTYAIADCGSRNGTWVDGKRVSRARLEDGAVVRVGRSLMVFVDVTIAPHGALVPESPLLLGRSLRMQRVRGEVAQVAPSPIPVLVLGESGSGKERAARAIHEASGRRGPFVAVNCATLPEALADSELFGHTQGAFTGATAKTGGLFLAADGGTLFLDELAELPAAVQAKLLRAVATGEVRSLGRADAQRFDARIVAATNADLAQAIAGDAFRGDLFARLAGWSLRLPPLRDRRDDVLRLAEPILARAGVALTTSAAEALLLHDWPFNVRELEQALAAACVRAAEGGRLMPSHLPTSIAERVASRTTVRPPPKVVLETIVPGYCVPNGDELRAVIAHFGGNVKRVAAYFNRDRKQIYRWAAEHTIDLAALRVEGAPSDS